jgi:DNA-binding NarL/FixJ family response regulator
MKNNKGLRYMDEGNSIKKKEFLLVSSSTAMCERYRTMIEQERNYSVFTISYPELVGGILKTRSIDFIILTMSACDPNIMSFIENLKKHHPDISVLVITDDDEAGCVDDVCKAGADGFMIKKDESMLISAIQTILSGKRFISEVAMNFYLQKTLFRGSDTYEESGNAFSFEEHEVFQLIARGFDIDQIAETLNVSREKVLMYQNRLKNKTNGTTQGNKT